MIRLLSFLEIRYPYDDPLKMQRAQSLLYMIAVVAAAWAISGVINTLPAILSGTAGITTYIFAVVTPFALLAIWRAAETGRVDIASVVFIAFLTLSITPTVLTVPSLSLGILLIVPLVAGSALFNRVGALVVFAVMLSLLFGRAVMLGSTDGIIRFVPSVDGAAEIALTALILISSAVFLIGFSGTTERIAQSSLQDLRHWQIFSTFNVTDETEPDHVIEQALGLLQHELDYNLAQFYVVDETGVVTRRIRVGAVDRQLAVRAEDLPTIGSVVREKTGRAFRRENSVVGEYPLPPSRIGIAFPVLYQGILLGVLDAQTRRNEQPSASQMEAFQAFSSTIAFTLMNARRMLELQKTVDDQEGVIASFRTRLTELQSRGAQLVSSSWLRYLEGRGGTAFGFDVETPEGKAIPRAAADLPAPIRATLERGDLFIEDAEDGSRVVHVPILLREEVLGGMTFTVPADRPLTDRQIEALRTISNRLGQSLENNRLFEQVQAQALREKKASEVSAQLISATNVESLLELAASSFNEALGAVYTRVLIEADPTDEKSGTRGTSTNGHYANGGSPNGMSGANGAHERS